MNLQYIESSLLHYPSIEVTRCGQLRARSVSSPQTTSLHHGLQQTTHRHDRRQDLSSNQGAEEEGSDCWSQTGRTKDDTKV